MLPRAGGAAYVRMTGPWKDGGIREANAHLSQQEISG